MTTASRTPGRICASGELAELGKYAFTVDYRGERRPALLVRHEGQVYGYLNRCVHLPRPLDGEEDDIFDATGRFLQCSIHNVQYDPATGEAISEICVGKRLTALKVEEREGVIYLLEKRATLVNGP
jgi:nitrite reductase/ring-hydroxylating ferredoxin subunit